MAIEKWLGKECCRHLSLTLQEQYKWELPDRRKLLADWVCNNFSRCNSWHRC
jgi:hypothetical protein